MIYTPRGVSVESATFTKIDTRFVVSLPQKSKEFITSTLKGNKICQIFQGTHRLWIEVLKKSFEDTLKITRKQSRRKRYTTNQRHKRQYGGFLNRYGFVYAGRYTVNQAAEFTPNVIKAAKNDLNRISQQRIN